MAKEKERRRTPGRLRRWVDWREDERLLLAELLRWGRAGVYACWRP